MKEKNLLYFSALMAVIVLLSILSEFILLLVHGISQMVFEGNSTGKTLVMLCWFFLLPLISVAFLKFNLYKKIQMHSSKFLKIFLLFAFLGYALGLIQFVLIASEFNSLGPFATISENNGVINWQASKLSHNHFPKASLYYFESLIGLNFKGSYDDGFPWFSFVPNPELWSVLYLLIELIILVSGILFINSKIKETSFFDFIVFLAGFLALIISVIDGGVASGAAMMAIFFFAVYFLRNYFKTENHVLATLLPLMVIGFIGFADVVLPLEIGNNFYASSIILFFGLTYYFVSAKKFSKLNFNLLNAVLALMLVVSFVISGALFFEFSFGREIQPLFLSYDFQENDKDAGIFIYGLPENLDKSEIDVEVENFGEIIDSDKAGWSYYALISPKSNFRTSELEILLQERFDDGSYLYVEQVAPLKQINSYRIFWFTEDFNSTELLREEFLASRIIQKTDNYKNNSTEIIVEERVLYLWEMLSILSEARFNGFKGKILLIKNS